ncbi:MAG: metallophosphoesterase family protein, partial [Opitutaceae bacterium]|nr:metallophosphoesterase family protein [Opitutaceae bacterium]
MQIALLADIHGNLAALEAVLAELDRLRPDRIAVLGDIV